MGARTTALLLVALTACSSSGAADAPVLDLAVPDVSTTTTAAATTTTAAAPHVTAGTAPTPPRTVRSVTDEPYTAFAVAGPVTLRHPASRVERVGFHQSNHDGARTLDPLPTAVAPVTLEGRERDTGGRTAADVVVDPAAAIRSPVTGTVKRSGGYVLYCKYHDDYVVIAPDDRPDWEVKVLHIHGVRVRKGDRVTAGETVIAPRATRLPFASQVDDLRTADPAWPHVHVEVVDPAIKDRPTPGGCP